MERPITWILETGANAALSFVDAFGEVRDEDSSASDSDQASFESLSSSFTSDESTGRPVSEPEITSLEGSALHFHHHTHLSPHSTSFATTPTAMDGDQGEITPLVPKAHDPTFLDKLEAAIERLSLKQDKCSVRCEESRQELKEEFMAAHADQYATFQERLAETQRKQADMQELFKQEMLAEQRKQGELVNAQLRTIAKQLTDSSVLRKREREDQYSGNLRSVQDKCLYRR